MVTKNKQNHLHPFHSGPSPIAEDTDQLQQHKNIHYNAGSSTATAFLFSLLKMFALCFTFMKTKRSFESSIYILGMSVLTCYVSLNLN